MNYSLLSPTECAEELVSEIRKITFPDQDILLTNLVRQLARDIYENSARIAEDWAARNDRPGRLTSEQAGDAIAEELRRLADERSFVRKATA